MLLRSNPSGEACNPLQSAIPGLRSQLVNVALLFCWTMSRQQRTENSSAQMGGCLPNNVVWCTDGIRATSTLLSSQSVNLWLPLSIKLKRVDVTTSQG
eukprot:251791-Amphidinium_carterae.1